MSVSSSQELVACIAPGYSRLRLPVTEYKQTKILGQKDCAAALTLYSPEYLFVLFSY